MNFGGFFQGKPAEVCPFILDDLSRTVRELALTGEPSTQFRQTLLASAAEDGEYHKIPVRGSTQRAVRVDLAVFELALADQNVAALLVNGLVKF